MGSRSFSTTVAACVCLALLLLQQGARAVPLPTDGLKFFKNYFVTGDYVVGGVGLWGRDSGTIAMNGAPAGAEVLAAFLYWQVVSPVDPSAAHGDATFNEQPLSTPADLPSTEAGPLAAALESIGGTEACLISGGFGGAGNRVHSYRADVLRFLDVGEGGRHRINGTYVVRLPNDGTLTRTLGASLVVIYRNPNPSPTSALNAIVMYDGLFTKQQQATMSQQVEGFYDPANVSGKITYVVGSAQGGLGERLNGPFVSEVGAFGGALGNAWDNVTRPTNPLGGAASFNTSISRQYTGPFSFLNDCVTMGAIVYRTQVNDSDSDGLLNRWELATSATPILTPLGEVLPPLADMSANPAVPDLFVEVGYMANAAATYGGVAKPAHSHLPTYEALQKVGDAFSAKGINVHFDVGGNYAGLPYIVPAASARGGESLMETITQCTPGVADTPWTLTPDQPWNCQFDNHPGTVGWKTGFRFIRDEPPAGVTYDACDVLETDGNVSTTCSRRFDANRRDMFHYVWFAHALGLPKESCIVTYNPDAEITPDTSDTANAGDPGIGFPSVTCQQGDPFFHVPVTNSGVADFPGGDAMVALGGFDNALGEPVGTDYMQAATLMHELGHNFHLRHGAVATGGVVVPEPNCKPNYQSVMNYSFQLRGLFSVSGSPSPDFSGQLLAPLIETGLPSGLFDSLNPGVGPTYRTGWYAPRANIRFGTGPAATKHCDGTPLTAQEELDRLAGNGMVRVDSASVLDTHTALDWDMNPSTVTPDPQDVNFDGVIGGVLSGFNDWAHVRLNQVASRRNVGGWYWVLDEATSMYAAYLGPLSLNVGHGDLGHGDLGHGDLGHGDLGHGDLGHGDLGHGDLGHGDLGHGDLGHGDLGHGDLGHGDLGHGDLGIGPGEDANSSEVSFELAAATALFGPPTDVKAFVRGTDGAAGTNSSVPTGSWVPMGEPTNCSTLTPSQCHRIRVDWKAPAATAASSYRVFREIEGSEMPQEITGPGGVPYNQGPPGAFTLIDTTELPQGGRFTYFVTATFVGGAGASESVSDPATITAVNELPIAQDDPNAANPAERYTTPFNTNLTIVAPGVVANDVNGAGLRDVDSPVLTLAVVAGPAQGAAVLNGNGSFIYDPGDTFVGDDQFRYKVTSPADPTRAAEATVRIRVNAPVVIASIKPESADVWFTNNRSSTTKFDLKAEVLRNGTPVATATLTNTTLGYGTTFAKATYKQISSGFTSSSVPFSATDMLSLRVSVKLSNASGAPSSAPIKLYYNIPTPPGNDGHLHAKIGTTGVKYYMIRTAAGALGLQKNGSVPGPRQEIDFTVTSKTTYTPLGTWSITGP